MKSDIFSLKDEKKLANTISITNNSKNYIDDAISIFRNLKIPDNYNKSKKIKDSISILEDMKKNINKANSALESKINEIIAMQRKKYSLKTGNLLLKNNKQLFQYGKNYKELSTMDYNEVIKFFSQKVLETPVLQVLKNPLDNNNSEIRAGKREKNMMNYAYRIESKDSTKSSVCQGGICWGLNSVIYADVNTNINTGTLRFMKKNKKYEFKNLKFDRTAIEKEGFAINLKGHSNDLAKVTLLDYILHINQIDNTIDVYRVNEYEKETQYVKSINVKANGVGYDNIDEKLYTLSGVKLDCYSKNKLINNENEKAIEQYIIPDKIKDEKNSVYYNYVQGITAYDEIVYVAYSGFSTDKWSYSYKDGDQPVGNMIVAYYKGEAIGRITDNVGIELESIDFNEKGNLVAFYNGGPYTRVFETDLVNANEISDKYKPDN